MGAKCSTPSAFAPPAAFRYNRGMISLVAFLGNYGREYERTRHNVGWQFAQSLPFYNALNWREQFKGDFSVLETPRFAELVAQHGLLTTKDGSTPPVPKNAPEKLYFLKPLTYMNASGEAIGELAHFYKIPAEQVLVVHDELELPFGTVSLKWSGGLGGHNGLRSTKAALATADFWRLRFGLTKPQNRDIADYVLSAFTQDEQQSLTTVFAQAATLFARLLLASEPQRLIAEWGKKKVLA